MQNHSAFTPTEPKRLLPEDLGRQPGGKSLSYKRKARLMGILNVTPDSFYAEGRAEILSDAVAQAKAMEEEGADLIDIGGESTRPGAPSVSLEEELRRVLPVIEALRSEVSIPLSIDTKKPAVAAQAIELGVTLLNDVTGLELKEMQEIAASTGVEVCVMHMKGTPETMQNSPNYPRGVVDEIIEWMELRVELLLKEGVQERQIILDPGIGFGKSIEDNIDIFQNLQKFSRLGFPLAIGGSRKSFMQRILKKTVNEVLSTTLAIHTMALMADVNIIRAHDVREHRDIIDLLFRFQKRERSVREEDEVLLFRGT